MWAQGIYDLGLTEERFWRMTPRQFAWLCDRQREEMAHHELIGAWITTAVKNHSMCPPEKPAELLDYMPSHREREGKGATRELTEEEQERISDWNIKVAEAAVRMREQADGCGVDVSG